MKLSSKNILLNILTIISLSSYGIAQTAVAPAPKEVTDKVVEKKTAPEKKENPAPVIKKEKPAPATKVYGWKEWVWVIKPELVVRAKLDTGAQTCSIHATNVEQIEVDGKKWVKFTISDPQNKKSRRVKYKAPLLRVSKIKNDRGGIDERYVVPLTFQIGDRKLIGEFNLNDRTEMVCAMLIGRNVLQKIGYVDSGNIDLLKKKTPKAKKPAVSNK